MSDGNPETLLQDLTEQRKKLREVLANYTHAYEELIRKLKQAEETDEAKGVKKKALDNLLAIEDEYRHLNKQIDRVRQMNK